MDYEELKEQFKKGTELREKKILDWLIHIPRNPRGLGILEQVTINDKPFSSISSEALEQELNKSNMEYIVHLKYPIMFWDKDHLVIVKKISMFEEFHIITQDGVRYVELPRRRYKIGEDPTRGSNYFVPITYYSLDDIPDVDLEQSVTEEE